ncbi:MAG: Hsp70 family protein [Candidatus Promineifilaceae bacterium]|nr:Hsp70 family protein [Candidatus Promineifilaceae bacterium]
MIIGMDFGTTNSGIAVYDGRKIDVLPLDPAGTNPRVLRTALYITNEQTIVIGRKAIDLYYEQNIGRVVKTRKVWIGEIEVYAEDLYYVTDAYAWVDESEPGRLLLSVKSRLREEDHPGAIVGQHFYTLEDLIALYLTVARVRAEQILEQDVRQVVLGRPVHFSLDPEHDRLAQGRLLQAAFRAGFDEVYLQFEPVAAAFSYGTSIDQPQNVLVFDFGGGTLDITVMHLGETGQEKALASGGIPVAGDVFDQKMTRAKLPKHFGEGSLYGSRQKAKQTPRWIYDAFSSWQTIIELQTQENRRVLEDIARTAQRRYQLDALISLVTSNYGLKMFDQVELAKRNLSTKRGAQIRLDGPDFKVREFATRTEFERIIRPDILAVEAELSRTLEASGLHVDQIDAVIRTGGSAQIPVFHDLLSNMFGAEKVQSVNTFSSVTAGLGVLAHKIESGELEAQVFTPEDVAPPPQAKGSKPRISRANLDLMQKRITLAEGVMQRSDDLEDSIVVFLGEGQKLRAEKLTASQVQEKVVISLPDIGLSLQPQQVIVAKPDEHLLLITSQYRFLLITPRQLLDLQSLDMGLGDHHRMAVEETVCRMGSWSQITCKERLLIITNRGFARAFPLDILRRSVEGPVPLKLDERLFGLPVGIIGVDSEDEFVLITKNGRGLRWPVQQLRVAGTQVVNCGKVDQVVDVALALPDDELILLTADGFGRKLVVRWVPIPSGPNKSGKSLIARRSSLATVAKENNWILTNQNLRAMAFTSLPMVDSTKSKPVIKLDPQEFVVDALPSLLV